MRSVGPGPVWACVTLTQGRASSCRVLSRGAVLAVGCHMTDDLACFKTMSRLHRAWLGPLGLPRVQPAVGQLWPHLEASGNAHFVVRPGWWQNQCLVIIGLSPQVLDGGQLGPTLRSCRPPTFLVLCPPVCKASSRECPLGRVPHTLSLFCRKSPVVLKAHWSVKAH